MTQEFVVFTVHMTVHIKLAAIYKNLKEMFRGIF